MSGPPFESIGPVGAPHGYIHFDLVAVGIADAEPAVVLAERRETVRLHPPSGRGEILRRRADVERDVVEAGAGPSARASSQETS